MIETYIFDLYGTLVDIHTDESMPVLWRRMALLLSLQGASYAPEELKRAYHLAVEEQNEARASQLPDILKDHVEPDILLVFKSLYAQKGVAVSGDTVQDAALFFRTLSLRRLTVYPGAVSVLRSLRARGRGVYLLSNAQVAFTVPELRKLGLLSLFDGIVISSDVGIKKPDRAIFEHILSQYGLRPETCLMIGNDAEADMQGAASVGMAGRYIHTNQSPDRQQPLPKGCLEIRTLKELL